MMSIVTNIDADHMDTYAANDFARLKQAFVDFIHRMPSTVPRCCAWTTPACALVMPDDLRPW